MATPLKAYYDDTFFDYFIASFREVDPTLDGEKFKRDVYAGAWERLELKERMRRAADVLAAHLPADFALAAPYLIRHTDRWHRTGRRGFGLQLLFLGDFVERYGLHDVETSIRVIEKITTLGSAEFAVRPFLNRYPDRMAEQMERWSNHPDESVRRLSFEGYRPRLPWGLAVPRLKKDPAPVLRVLETLKNDPSETVRRSVANNLNDIGKDHPETVVELLFRWKTQHPETEKIVKHAARTLLKRGHPGALALFGSGSSEYLALTVTRGIDPETAVGGTQAFAFDVRHTGPAEQKIRVEYVIYFLLKNGQHGRKVFFVTEKTLPPGGGTHIKKSHTFRPITTRIYYPGIHRMAVLLNGKEYALGTFELK